MTPAKVKKGAELLDQKKPGWAAKIKTKKLFSETLYFFAISNVE